MHNGGGWTREDLEYFKVKVFMLVSLLLVIVAQASMTWSDTLHMSIIIIGISWIFNAVAVRVFEEYGVGRNARTLFRLISPIMVLEYIVLNIISRV